MRSRNLLRMFVLASALYASAFALAAIEGVQPLRIVVAASTTANHLQLEFAMSNTSDERITIRKRDLPWEDPANVIAVLVAKKSGVPLQKSHLIQDYFPTLETVELAPGQSIRGTLSLTTYDAAFASTTGRGSIVAGWYYGAKDADGRSLGSYGGWLEVPKPKPLGRRS